MNCGASVDSPSPNDTMMEGFYLLELRGVQRVLDLLGALRQTFSAGEEGEESLLHLGVSQDGSHHLRSANAGEVHCRAAEQAVSHV